MRNLQVHKGLMVRKTSYLARHSVVKEETDKGTLLENLKDKLGIQK